MANECLNIIKISGPKASIIKFKQESVRYNFVCNNRIHSCSLIIENLYPYPVLNYSDVPEETQDNDLWLKFNISIIDLH